MDEALCKIWYVVYVHDWNLMDDDDIVKWRVRHGSCYLRIGHVYNIKYRTSNDESFTLRFTARIRDDE